ncbi:MAG: hypothetical protein NW220_20055 [Leptolyngbyaceae cyanobacterium bins.349]|nr:hypothetical protein [Leptolyngbyaceae cyanobacterium bins.349]
MADVKLADRDYTVIIAKTAGTTAIAPPHFEQRWTDARAAIVALTQTCEQFDPDGITIYMSSKNNAGGSFQQYKQVSSDQIDPIFAANYPPDELNLLEGLQLALDDYFARKAANQTKPNGAMIIVLVDGEPRDRLSVVKTIVQAAAQIERDDELGIGFVQVGDDLIARGFLNALDQDLRSQAGAKFDIVHTRVLETIEPSSLTNFLTDIIQC